MPNSVISKLTVSNAGGISVTYDIKDAAAREALSNIEIGYTIHVTGSNVDGGVQYTIQESFSDILAAHNAGKSLKLNVIEPSGVYVIREYKYGTFNGINMFMFTDAVTLLKTEAYTYLITSVEGSTSCTKIEQTIKPLVADSNSAITLGNDGNDNIIDVKIDGTTIVKNGTTGVLSAVTSQVNSDWNASSGAAQILNKPSTVPMVVTFTNNTTQTYNVYIASGTSA